MAEVQPRRTFRPRNTERARSLRREATPFERLLWRGISGGQTGARFSRQMPVGPWFADFLCRELKLVVELDGFSHEGRLAEDAARDAWMSAQGYRIVRFTNADLRENLEGVLRAIALVVAELRSGQR